MRDPKTREEWQNAVDAADGALTLESARLYGLVTGGPEVNTARCEEILAAGKLRGVTPSADATERFMASLLANQKAAS